MRTHFSILCLALLSAVSAANIMFRAANPAPLVIAPGAEIVPDEYLVIYDENSITTEAEKQELTLSIVEMLLAMPGHFEMISEYSNGNMSWIDMSLRSFLRISFFL
jgi:hypothetical protein